MVTRWQMDLSTDAWRLVGAGGHMEMKEMCPRNNSLCKDYGVRVVSNIFPIFSSLLFPLVQM
jgi:hypothetical protein